MELIIGFAVLIVWLLFVVLISTEKIHALIGMMAMAVLMTIVAGGSFENVMAVLNNGPRTMAGSVIIYILGSMVGVALVETGIAEAIIRKSAELAGERRIIAAIALMSAVAFIGMGILSTGMSITIAVIVLPIMFSLGISKHSSATLFIFGSVIGWLSNFAFWSVIRGIVTGVVPEAPDVFKTMSWWPLTACVVIWLMGIVYIGVELKRGRFFASSASWSTDTEVGRKPPKIPVYSYITPIIPVITYVVLGIPEIPSFIIGVLYAILTTHRVRGGSWGEELALIHKCVYKGAIEAALPATMIMTIGMVIETTKVQAVMNALEAAFSPILPSPDNILAWVLFFAILAPFGLYRGIMNWWGLGALTYAIIINVGGIDPLIAFMWMMAVMPTPWIACPTLTTTTWVLGYCDYPFGLYPRRTLPYSWLVTIVLLIITTVALVL